MHKYFDGFWLYIGLAARPWWQKAHRCIRIALYATIPVFCAFCLFAIEFLNISSANQHTTVFERLVLFAGWIQRFSGPAIFGLFVIFLLFGFVLLLSRKAYLAAAFVGLTSLGLGIANFMKVASNGDNLFPHDFLFASYIDQIAGFITVWPPPAFWAFVAVCAAWVFAFACFDIRLHIKKRISIPAATAIFFTFVIAFAMPVTTQTSFLNRFGMYLQDARLQSSNYRANGFIGAFMINLTSLNVARPAGYSEHAISMLLDGRTKRYATQEYFDVIVVLSESFFDVRTLPGVYFSENPLSNFDEVSSSPRAFSGLVYTTALMGGTVRPEFEILTGLSTDFFPLGSNPYSLIREPIMAFPAMYAARGYRTVAVHPFDRQFYMRHIAYPFMGFDSFFGDMCTPAMRDLPRNHRFALDVPLFYVAMDFFEEAARTPAHGNSGQAPAHGSIGQAPAHGSNGQASAHGNSGQASAPGNSGQASAPGNSADHNPVFMKIITMQNHQPFQLQPDATITVQSDLLDAHTLAHLEAYTNGLRDADEMLGLLVGFVRSRTRPTVVLFYGDHLPNFGGFINAHLQSGLICETELHLPHARKIMYSTPFLIYANRDLQPLLQNKDNHVSAFYLMPILAYKTGFYITPYMCLLLSHFGEIPYYNSRLHMERSPQSASLMHTLALVTYDRIIGENFSVHPFYMP